MVVGAVIAAAVGSLIAYLCLRYRLAGAYFALATFAFAQMFLLLVQNLETFKQDRGLQHRDPAHRLVGQAAVPAGQPVLLLDPARPARRRCPATILFAHSRSGQFVQAARDDETAAASLGIDAMRHRLLTVALSCGLTAVAGAYYTQYYLFVGPGQAFGSSVSIEAIVPAVIGGIGTIWGPVIGARSSARSPRWWPACCATRRTFLDFLQGKAGLDVALYAVILIAIVLFLPKGVFGSIRDRWRR